VTPPERLAQTFEWDGLPGHVLVSVAHFEDLGDGRTRVVTTSLFYAVEDRVGKLSSGMEQGLSESHGARAAHVGLPGPPLRHDSDILQLPDADPPSAAPRERIESPLDSRPSR